MANLKSGTLIGGNMIWNTGNMPLRVVDSKLFINTSEVYTTTFKPTPADVGAVNKTGDTMTGRLTIEGRSSAGSFGVKRNTATQFANFGQSSDTGGEALIGVGPTAEDYVNYLKVGNNKLTYQGGSGEKKIYHEGFKPTAADVGAYTKAEADSRLVSKTIGNPQSLSTEDLDNLKTPGVFSQNSNANTSAARHYPENAAGSLVITYGAGPIQTYHVYNSSRVWTRAQYSNGGWTAWARQYNTANKPTAADVGALALTGGTLSSALTINTSGGQFALSINAPSGKSNYIIAKKGTTNSWYIGNGSDSNDDVGWNSYIHSTNLTLRRDYVESNKPFKTTFAGAFGFMAERAGHIVSIGNSQTAGEYLFGGKPTADADYKHYIRLGNNKFQYNQAGTTYDVYHTGRKPSAGDVGAIVGTTHNSPMRSSTNGQWQTLARVRMPQSASTCKFTIIGGTGFNTGNYNQATQTEIIIRSGNNNPKGITAVVYNIGGTNPIIASVAYKLVSGDDYDIVVQTGSYAHVAIRVDFIGASATFVSWGTDTPSSTKPSGLTDGKIISSYNTSYAPTASAVGAIPTTGGTYSGLLVTSSRDGGLCGTYDANKTNQIWSIGSNYKNSADGSNFGNLYGLGYKHTNNPTGGTMADGHQAVWCNTGTPRSAMGDGGFWTTGRYRSTFAGYAFETLGGYIRSNTASVASLDGKQHSFVTAPLDAHLCSNAYWDGTAWKKYDNAKVSSYLVMRSGTIELKISDAGQTSPQQKSYTFYHTGNKPTASDVGALPIGGGVLTGQLQLKDGQKSALAVRNGSSIRFSDGGSSWMHLIAQGSALKLFSGGDSSLSEHISFKHPGVITSQAKPQSMNEGTYNGTTEGGVWRRGQGVYHAKVTHSGSSWAPMFSGYFHNTDGYAGYYSIGHLAQGGANSGTFCVSYMTDSGGSHRYWAFNGSNGDFTSPGNVVAYSDVRVKSNIETIENALDKIDQIRGVTYDRTDMDTSRQMGVIAQEVEKVAPEVVTTSHKGDIEDFKAVAYGNLSALLIEGIKELRSELTAIKSHLGL